MSDSQDFQRSLAVGSRALQYIKQTRSTAVPRNYEIWYTYACGEHKQLIVALNKLLSTHQTISNNDLEELYNTYLSSDRVEEKTDKVSAHICQEIKQIALHLREMRASTGKYGDSLEELGDHLEDVKSVDDLGNVIQVLADLTQNMAEDSRQMESRLVASSGQIERLHADLEAARAETHTDPLTGIANRKKFDVFLAEGIAEAREEQTPLSLLFLDIDHFKKFNDTWGHQTGDQVLRLVASTLSVNLKGRDLAARYGGEEFAVVLPKTALQDAAVVAEHIRNAVQSKELVKKSTGESLGKITLSAGAATLRPGDTINSLIHRADACLYAAKHAGRNQVKTEMEIEGQSTLGAA